MFLVKQKQKVSNCIIFDHLIEYNTIYEDACAY